MSVFGVLTKLATEENFQLWASFLTYTTGFLLFLPVIWKLGLHSFKTDEWPKHLGRVGFGLTASFLYMISLHYIPLVNATLLFNSSPLFIPLFAIFLLNDSVSKSTWLAVLLGFIGIVIVIKPDLNLLQKPGNLIALISGLSLAIAYIFIQMLSSTSSIRLIVFYFFFLATCIQLPILLLTETQWPPFYVIGISIGAGIAFLGAQILLAQAYSYAPASKIGAFQYSSVVFVGLIDWIVWGAAPSASDLIGALLVVIAGIIIIRNR